MSLGVHTTLSTLSKLFLHNSSSSIVGVAQRRIPPPAALEHKDSYASLKSLRELGGGGKPMHVLIPDMPIMPIQNCLYMCFLSTIILQSRGLLQNMIRISNILL